ncbi:MAG: hypothetical protein KF866_08060 [Phycisphaeraceae bacterium]|nr:hypothetical protein [Phycisphaeraceae bacterium]
MAEQVQASPSAAPPQGSGQARFRTPAEPSPREFDALADLFLGPDGLTEDQHRPQRRRQPPTGGTLPIEALVLGHLPVLAPAWVKQFAAHRAGELGGPVGLVRVSGGTLSVELIGETASGVASTDLGEALGRCAEAATAWLVRVDEPLEPLLAGEVSDAIASMTLLSGTDETAIVACYRAIKGLASDPADSSPALRVAWMGSTREKAAEAMAKVQRACAAFLSRPVEDAGCVEKIDVTRSTMLYRGETPGNLAMLLSLLRSTEPRSPEPPPRDQGVLRLTTANDLDDQSLLDDPLDLDSANAELGHGEALRPLDAHVPNTHRQVRSGEHVPGMPPVSGVRPVIVEYVSGLKPLPVTCPDAPAATLAMDAEGRLHVLREALGEMAVEEALAHLTTAQAWAGKNAEILKMAIPGLRNTAAVCHLLTDRPREARKLLDAPVTIHALLAVSLGGSVGWASAPING